MRLLRNPYKIEHEPLTSGNWYYCAYQWRGGMWRYIRLSPTWEGAMKVIHQHKRDLPFDEF